MVGFTCALVSGSPGMKTLCWGCGLTASLLDSSGESTLLPAIQELLSPISQQSVELEDLILDSLT